MVWPEVELALKNRRYELILTGDKLTKYLQSEKEFDETIWSLKQLNFLEISNCSLIQMIPENLGQLIHLSTLTLTNNQIRQLPKQIVLLENLRHFNVSNNQLEHLDQHFFSHFNQLETFNLSNNKLKSLPPFSSEINLKLAILNVSHNQLHSLEHFPPELENLCQIDLSSNLFKDFPQTLFNLSSLKILLLDSNELVEIPCQLGQLPKLKELRFKSNPIKDNRLKKLMEQDKIKPVIEYLARQWNEQQQKQRKPAPTPMPHQNVSKEIENSIRQDQIRVLHFDQQGDLKGKQITILPRVVNVRANLLCCIVRNINLATPGNLKKFINLQNELHDGICQKRTLATIATHDLTLITGNLVYDARDPNEIGLVPLGKGSKVVSAKDFYDQLCQDAEHERKLKKRNQFSGLHKYLTLLEGQNEFACLSDEDRYVISLPPLTNAERSKLSPSTESLFIEITSSSSMEICRRVMDSFLKEIVQLELGEQQTGSNIRQVLTLQQTRVVDEKGQLKTTFPSRTDLDWSEVCDGSIVIQRLFN